ncbi:MAG: hypothetical protein LBL55_09605 [Propionibacteriaceae bacterium]|jgi:uncharacterized membrane protein YesL|nr:hypothetical protein [Propionibacteriaceae bacterium]
MRSSFGAAFLSISGTCYVILGVDLMLLLTTWPVTALLVATDPRQSWLALVLVSPLLAPAVTAASTVFRRFWLDGSANVLSGFARAWWQARPTLLIGAAGAGLGAVLVVDAQFVSTSPWGALTLPPLVVATVLAGLVFPYALVAWSEHPGLKARHALRAGLLVALRRWPSSLVSLAALALLAGLFVVRPALVALVLPAPVLYIVWSGARRGLTSLRPDLPWLPRTDHQVGPAPVASPAGTHTVVPRPGGASLTLSRGSARTR